MDLLRIAVVDITTLVAACHALMSAPLEGELGMHRKLRNRLRRDIKCATVSYIVLCSGSARSRVDAARLPSWLAAAGLTTPRAREFRSGHRARGLSAVRDRSVNAWSASAALKCRTLTAVAPSARYFVRT